MAVALVSSNAELNARIDDFVTAADCVTAKYWTAQGFTHAPSPKHRADFLSDKWVRVMTVELRDDKWADSYVYAFIALADNQTKVLGAVKTGDIHKAATLKAPAKHARGNVFASNFRECLTAHGIVYLR